MSQLLLPRRFGANQQVIDLSSDPLHLTSRPTTIQVQSGGSINAIALRNPHHLAMEISEIKFRLTVLAGADAEEGPPPNFQKVNGASLLVGLALVDSTGARRTKLTGAQVPAWNFGPGRWRGWVDQEYQEATDYAQAEYSWPLSRPFYIPPGYGVEPILTSTGFLTNLVTSLEFRMSLVGRSLPEGAPKPTESQVPFATAYRTDPFNAFNEVAEQESDETDLMNTTDAVLHVDRFIGRANLFVNTGAEGRDDDLEWASSTALQIRMMNSRGDAIIDRPTPFRAVFGSDDRSLDMYHDMLPGDYYRVFVRNDNDQNDDTNNGTVCVSFTGWRSIPLRSL